MTPTTGLYTFLINHFKFLTVRRTESGGSPAARLGHCAGSPSSPAPGTPVPPHSIAWAHQALVSPGCPATMGSGITLLFSAPSQCPPPCRGCDSPAELSGSSTGERGNLLKQANCNDSPFPNVSRFVGERRKLVKGEDLLGISSSQSPAPSPAAPTPPSAETPCNPG